MNIDALRERARIVRTIRQFFDAHDFVEVETAVRIPAPAPEEHIDCPPVVDGGYLRASPELQMKKLLAAGMDRIYQIGPCFREGEKGSRHNPEFTMIEWYRRNATYLDIMDDLERLLTSFSDSSFVDCHSSFRKLRVRDAYAEFAGWDPWTSWDQDRFDFDMATKVEPAIKTLGGGVFLMDYPPQAASLSKLSTREVPPPVPSSPFPHPSSPSPVPSSPFPHPSSPFPVPSSLFPLPSSPFPLPSSLPYAERWEFYYEGMELANCFTELCDQEEQTRRFKLSKEARKALKESDYPIDWEFLSALPQIGSAAGVAMGIDRLVMVLTKIKEISNVRAQI